jgi:ribosomal protein S18 acetylase RimI-like enzyme
MTPVSSMEIRKLEDLNPDDFRRIMTGYTSTNKYIVKKTEKHDLTTITMRLATLTNPYVKNFPQLPDEMKRYQQIVKQSTSLGAYEGGRLVGLAISERRDWNRSLWVWELGVEKEHRRAGVGTQLVEALVRVAKDLNLRIIVCETQNTNVPAIEFYRKTGFEVEGIDLSYYSNTDTTTGEVAIFHEEETELMDGLSLLCVRTLDTTII